MRRNSPLKKIFLYILLIVFFVGIIKPTITNAQVIANTDVLTAISNDTTIEEARQNIELQQPASSGDEKKIGGLGCEGLDVGCYILDMLIFDIFIFIGNVFLGLSGLFLDFFLGHSIASSSYKDASFITQGWEILRDFTNIVFIFSLLVVAFKMVLGQNDGGNKERLVKTILIALTINFSLYASLLVIDVGNLLAHTFYNKIDAPVVNFDGSPVGTSDENYGVSDIVSTAPSVSLAIADGFKPQRILGNTTSGQPKGELIILGVVVGIVNYVAAFVFISVALLFLGRTVGLYISTVLSALSFATIALPEASNIPYVGFRQWFSEHIKLAFMAPVFLFFLYLAVLFLNINIFAGTSGGSFLQNLLTTVIPLAAVVTILMLAKKVANSMAGKLGSQISGYVTKTAQLGVGAASIVATGGAALGMSGIGRLAQGIGKVTKNEKISNFGSKTRNTSAYVGSAKFDVTKIPGFKMAFGKEATERIGSISGKSAMGHISSIKTERQKNPVFSSEYAQIQKEKIEREKTRVKEQVEKSKSSSDWQEELEKERDKILSENLAAEIGKELDKTFETDRKEEKKLYREVIDHATEVQKEEKDLKKLNDELSNLRQTLNAANASGDGTRIQIAKDAYNVQKVRIDARKKGRDISDTEAQAELNLNGGSTAFLKTTTKGSYTHIGSHADNYKSAYEQQRKEVQEKEQAFIDKRIKDKRDKANLSTTSQKEKNKLNKEATLIGKKGKSLLTDSEKEDKKGEFDKKESK